MKSSRNYIVSCLIALLATFSLTGQISSNKPVTAKASPEVSALLDLFYRISGKYILTGQHNFPDIKNRNTLFAAEYTGKTPVIFSTDWGFAKENDKDSYLARPEIVREAIRQHGSGSIITICWHAVPPTAKEPVTFQPVPGLSTPVLASVQGRLTDQQFKDILTPGTALYNSWCAQVDSVAHYLRLLQDAHVPVLWRPYHEMNGSWFWWGGRDGKYSTRALYRQLFNRLVKVHKLNNLLWIWSVDRPTRPEMKFSAFYPGNDYLDILALDVYGSDFNKAYYDSLIVLSKGKPIVLAEVGNPPSPEILSKQPEWCYYSTWAGMVRNTTRKEYDVLLNNPHVLSLEDPAYHEVSAPYRKVCGLPPLEASKKKSADFSGSWLFDEERSLLDKGGTANIPDRVEVTQSESALNLKKTFRQEESDDRVLSEVLSFGKTKASGENNLNQTTYLNRSENTDTLFVETRIIMKRGNQSYESVVSEKWFMSRNRRTLFCEQVSSGFRGKRNLLLVYDKE